MGRNRKWVFEDDLSETVWVLVLPHQWPVAQGQGRSASAAHCHRPSQAGSLRPPRPNRTPEAVAEAAAEEVVGECSGSFWRRESVGETVVL